MAADACTGGHFSTLELSNGDVLLLEEAPIRLLLIRSAFGIRAMSAYDWGTPDECLLLEPLLEWDCWCCCCFRVGSMGSDCTESASLESDFSDGGTEEVDFLRETSLLLANEFIM